MDGEKGETRKARERSGGLSPTAGKRTWRKTGEKEKGEMEAAEEQVGEEGGGRGLGFGERSPRGSTC